MTETGPVRQFMKRAAELATRVQMNQVDDVEAEVGVLAEEVRAQAAALPDGGEHFVSGLLRELKMQATVDTPDRAAVIKKLMSALSEPR